MGQVFVGRYSRLAGSEVEFGRGTCKSSRPEQPHVTSRVPLGGNCRVSGSGLLRSANRVGFLSHHIHYRGTYLGSIL